MISPVSRRNFGPITKIDARNSFENDFTHMSRYSSSFASPSYTYPRSVSFFASSNTRSGTHARACSLWTPYEIASATLALHGHPLVTRSRLNVSNLDVGRFATSARVQRAAPRNGSRLLFRSFLHLRWPLLDRVDHASDLHRRPIARDERVGATRCENVR